MDWIRFVLVLDVVVLGVITLLWTRSLRRQVRAREATVARTVRLHAVTTALSDALTVLDAASVVVQQGVASLAADAGFVALRTVDGAHLELASSVGVDHSPLDEPRRIVLDATTPFSSVVHERRPLFLERVDRAAASTTALAPAAPAAVPAVQSTTAWLRDAKALAALPLSLGGQCLGVLALGFRHERPFSDEDRAFLQVLAHECANAVDRARLYEGERLARLEAERANRAKDEFLATLSHELRTPLNAILGWSQMLLSGRLEAETTGRAIEAIERNARAQAALMRDLLDVSHMASGTLELKKEPIDLAACLDAALDTVRPSVDAKQITLCVRRDHQRYAVMGDAARLQQVFWNLLVNAVRFTPGDGRIDVTLTSTDSDAVVRVADTGMGIDASRLPHLFERFYQAEGPSRRAPGSMGLGLSIVRHLVEAHGGSVSASSEGPNQGATFVVRLPLSEVPAAAAEGCEP